MRQKEEVFITNSFEETQRLGEKFAKDTKLHLPGAALNIALCGELGSGKTTFVQGLAKGFGITKRIISPTFIIVRSYKLKAQNSNVKSTSQISKLFYHIDLYRIDDNKSIKGLGIEEIINDPQNIVAIEWAEKMEKLLPKKRWDVRFEFIDGNKRKITIKNPSTTNC